MSGVDVMTIAAWFGHRDGCMLMGSFTAIWPMSIEKRWASVSALGQRLLPPLNQIRRYCGFIEAKVM
jgi:hypothetical protein